MNKTTAKLLAILALFIALSPFVEDAFGWIAVSVLFTLYALLVFFFGWKKGTP